MTIEQIEPIIQAAKEGKPLQRRIWNEDPWKDVVGVPTWNFDFYVYRIKPVPREWTVYVYSDGISSYDPTECVRRAKVREVL